MITDEQPPFDTEYKLSEYLSRQFSAGKLEDENKDQKAIYTAIPAKLSVGKLYYFSNAIASTPITGEGLYLYKSTGFILVA